MSVVNLSYINLSNTDNSVKIVGMLLEQNNDTFMALLPENDIQDNVITMDLSYENWEELIKYLDFKEVEVFANDNGKIKKTIVRKCTRQIENSISWSVYRRDNYTYRYCGRSDVPLTVDHLVLWEKGGPSIEENLVTSCKRCNNKRGNMAYAEWLVSPYYKEISENLSEEVKGKNIKLIVMLSKISKRLHKRKR